MKPKLLDLFCGAGGCSVGYARAGWHVVGIDREQHRDYPFPMFVSDALDFIDTGWLDAGNFDAVAASPPCPRYSVATAAANRDKHPDLLGPIRDRLRAWGGAYVIENVPGAPLDNPVKLCGSMFDLGVRRHRLFETNIPMLAPQCDHAKQGTPFGVYGDHGDKNGPIPRVGGGSRAVKARDVKHAQEVMDIDWMTDWDDLADAIPPAYTEWLGTQLLASLEAAA